MGHMHKKILITGATGNIGRAVARALAFPGVKMAIHYHSSRDKAVVLMSELKKIGADISLIPADLSDVSGVRSLVSKAVEALGGLDLVVNMAATFEKMPLAEVTEEKWKNAIDVNLKAAFFLAQSAAAAMEKGGGKMIFFSDVAAVKPYGSYMPHCIAKAGVDAIVRGLARSLAPKIQVNAVAPYAVTRPEGMSDAGWNDILSKMPMRKASTPEEIAAVVKMLAESETITGQIITVDGGRLLR